MSRIIFRPELVHPTVFIASGAVVVGEVYLAEGVNIWFNAVLRGDVESLTLEANVNIQDGCVLHTSYGYPLLLEEGVSVGHRAIVHGARVGRNTLIGMGALLLDGVEVCADCIVAAGALLPRGKSYPTGSLIMGSPARVVRALTEEEIQHNREVAAAYVRRAQHYQE
ncbi:MAG: gamma carbonic anhydrase family protein [Anaerolineae bacterium]|jgi:carbonic anhydrase/acetyltransferase-like protein (isoleucine patch superfamily)|nr:gamma carbonic anhydrase family protein [Anaerolineae bacterium]